MAVGGSAGGIGGAVAEAFAAAGAEVIGLDRERADEPARRGRVVLRRPRAYGRALQRRRDQRPLARGRAGGRVHRRRLGRGAREQPDECLPLLEARDPPPAPGRRRRDREPVVRDGADGGRRRLRDPRVPGQQGGDPGLDAGDGIPLRTGGDPRQRDRAGADRDADEPAGAVGSEDPRPPARAASADGRLRPPRGRRRRGGLPRDGRVRHRRGPGGRRRLDGR